MSLTGLDREKCQQRNRVAARKGFEAVPLKFLRAPAPVGSGVTSAIGSLPADDAEALERINALLDNGNEPLTLEDVFIHYCEAANSNFIADRYAFMSRRTLKNIATDAAAGFAFMNSHRTGGLSSPAELPYGRTFCGRYENLTEGGERTVIGFYMLRGVYPNGESGPSTDTMSAGIRAGTIFDVSVGLYGGYAICDVCGNSLDDWEECKHWPGTTRRMTDEEIQSQKDRGVPDGCASYTMDDCHCGETSAVFDGAVPGAGFRKLVAGEKAGVLNGVELAQGRKAFAPLLSKGELMDLNSIKDTIQEAVTSAFQAVGIGSKDAARKNAKTQRNAGDFSAEEGTGLDEETKTTETEETTETQPENPAPPAEDPVLTAAHAAGIHTAEQFAALMERARNGDVVLSQAREKAKQLAIVAYGVDTEEGRQAVKEAHEQLDTASLATVNLCANNFKRMAVKLGLMSEDGGPKTRKSAAGELPNYAADVTNPEQEKQDTVIDTSEVYESRRKGLAQGSRKR